MKEQEWGPRTDQEQQKIYWVSQKKLSHKTEEKMLKKMKMTS